MMNKLELEAAFNKAASLVNQATNVHPDLLDVHPIGATDPPPYSEVVRAQIEGPLPYRKSDSGV